VGEDGKVVLPPMNNLLDQKVDRSGIYLLDNGQYLLLWVGKAAPPDLLQQIFGVSSLYSVDDSQLKLTLQNNEVSKQIVSIVEGIKKQNGQGHIFLEPMPCARLRKFVARVCASLCLMYPKCC